MWVEATYNRCFYQDGDWRKEHFVELENGMLIVYLVSQSACGTIARVNNVTTDETEITIMYQDDVGQKRNVVVVAGSVRTKELFVGFLHSQFSRTKEDIVFESVMIKHPTTSADGVEVMTSPTATSKRRESLGAASWDNITARMGTWQRRLFRLCGDGSMSYHEVTPIACVSLAASSSLAVVEGVGSRLQVLGRPFLEVFKKLFLLGHLVDEALPRQISFARLRVPHYAL